MEFGSPNSTDQKKLLAEICHVNSQNDAFMRFYNSIWRSSDEHFSVSMRKPVLKNHTDIIEAVKLLRRNATLSKNSFQHRAFGNVDQMEKEDLARRLVKTAFMIDCASKDYLSNNYQLDRSFPMKWESVQTFIEFLENTFAMTGSLPFRTMSSDRALRAWKLKRRHGIRFVPTNDLVQHLLYEPRACTVKLFHQTAYIKAHLAHTNRLALETNFDESVERYVASPPCVSTRIIFTSSSFSGSLPPQLLLETLLTLYYVLFPVSTDKRTAKFTKSLVNKKKLDPDLMIDNGSIRVIPPDFKFVFWAERLRILEAITANPPPRNKVVSWMERHTSERNALTVAILGLFLAVLFGFLGLLVGIAQLVVSVLAWKHPASSAA